MRIISQDGKTDVPYENCIIYATGGHVNAAAVGKSGYKEELGKYETPERAIRVIYEINSDYMMGRRVHVMPSK